MAAENENLLLRAHGVHITTKQVISHCRKDAKCTKMTNVCAKPAKVLFLSLNMQNFYVVVAIVVMGALISSLITHLILLVFICYHYAEGLYSNVDGALSTFRSCQT